MPRLFNDSSFQHTNPTFKQATGFPSPADDFFESRLDLNEQYIRHKEATFFARVQGNSMLGAGIHDQDLLIIDRSITPTHGHIIIAAIDGEFMVRRLHKQSGQVTLLAESKNYRPMTITDGQELLIWGVVTAVIHRV